MVYDLFTNSIAPKIIVNTLEKKIKFDAAEAYKADVKRYEEQRKDEKKARMNQYRKPDLEKFSNITGAIAYGAQTKSPKKTRYQKLFD